MNLVVCLDGCWLGRQLSQGVMKPLKQSGCWFVLPACILCLLDNRHFRHQQMKQFMVSCVLLASPEALTAIWALHEYQRQAGDIHFLSPSLRECYSCHEQ